MIERVEVWKRCWKDALLHRAMDHIMDRWSDEQGRDEWMDGWSLRDKVWDGVHVAALSKVNAGELYTEERVWVSGQGRNLTLCTHTTEACEHNWPGSLLRPAPENGLVEQRKHSERERDFNRIKRENMDWMRWTYLLDEKCREGEVQSLARVQLTPSSSGCQPPPPILHQLLPLRGPVNIKTN